MVEIEQCVVVVVAVVVEAALVVVVAESGCWFEEMHLSSEVAGEADAFIRIVLMGHVNLARHLCLSHL
jgi:hypothetical protein